VKYWACILIYVDDILCVHHDPGTSSAQTDKYFKMFPRGVGLPDPFLILDGLGSRFELPFLVYINNEEHEWWTCIGTPYGTQKWQVRDSTHQNGSFKMEIGRGKMEILQKKG
jgi:hypothetical protein